MKKSTRLIFEHIISVVVLATISIFAGNSHIYNNKIQKFDKELKTPTIDFVQGYLFNDFEESDYLSYFDQLKEVGYDTVIFQYSIEGNRSQGFAYYPTTKLTNLYDSITYNDNLSNFMKYAEIKDMKVFIGLSNDDDYWSNYTNYSYMESMAEVEKVAIDEINELYKNNASFVGWYFAYELFSNPLRWENKWADFTNIVIDKLNSLKDGKPLMISPFRQTLLGHVTNEYRMWNNYFRKTNFREGDIFAPQDSIGKITSKDYTKSSLITCYKYVQALSKSVAHSKTKLKYYVNIELFTKCDDGNLRIANFDRIKDQIKIASQFAEKVVSFAFSHEATTYGGYNTLEERLEFYNKFKNLVNNQK